MANGFNLSYLGQVINNAIGKIVNNYDSDLATIRNNIESLTYKVGFKADSTSVPKKTSQLINDSTYQTETQVNTIMNAHKNASIIDHPDGSVTLPKLGEDVIREGKLIPTIMPKLRHAEVYGTDTQVTGTLHEKLNCWAVKYDEYNMWDEVNSQFKIPAGVTKVRCNYCVFNFTPSAWVAICINNSGNILNYVSQSDNSLAVCTPIFEVNENDIIALYGSPNSELGASWFNLEVIE